MVGRKLLGHIQMNKTISTKGNVRQLVLEDPNINFQRREWLLRALDEGIIASSFPVWTDMVDRLIQEDMPQCVSTAAFCIGQQENTPDTLMHLRLLYLEFVLMKIAVLKYGSSGQT